ncbi:hypothetical protein [Deinococcus multiflagellatus]|uniref:Uncharacterized protein n=1 Tax=Deinococcus multiflagellatus TaxID=1656887 RepID=A0ABW1ZSN2_9DEIO
MERRLWEEGRSGSKLDTLNSQLRELLPDLLRLRCETAPVVLMTLLVYDLRTKDLAMERTWQVQEAARTLGRATVSAYRDLLAPTFEFLRSADLSVRVIGTPSVSVDDLELRLTPTMALFIVYLAVTRGRHTRKQLADVLYDGNESTLNVMLNRLYKVLRDHGLSSDLLGKPENVRRGGIHTTDHHRVTLDIDQYSANAAGLRAALGARGVSHLLANSDHPWVLTMREVWRRQYDL